MLRGLRLLLEVGHRFGRAVSGFLGGESLDFEEGRVQR